MNYLITSCFCKTSLLEDCLQHLYQDFPKDTQHILIDDHYPLHTQVDRLKIRMLAMKYGTRFIETPKNLGLHHAINYVTGVIGLKQEDIIILHDADDRASPGALQALVDVIQEPQIAVIGMMFEQIRNNFNSNGYEETTIHGHRVWLHKSVDMWNIAAYRYEWIESIGGFNEAFAYYGGLESYLYL